MRNFVFAAILVLLVSGCQLPTGPGVRRFESSPHVLIQPTAYGTGMRRTDKFLSIEHQPGELIWLTGCSLAGQPPNPSAPAVLGRATMVLKNSQRYATLHHLEVPIQGVLFRFSADCPSTTFPSGFALPINSNEPWLLGTESQCATAPPKPLTVTFVGELSYIRQRGLAKPPSALYPLQLTSLVTVGAQPRSFGVAPPAGAAPSTGSPLYPPDTTERYQDGLGGVFADSWLVPPGKQVNRTPVSAVLGLKRDGMVHCATGHLSPTGTRLELYDLTSDRSILTLSRAKAGAPLPPFSSAEGVKLERKHAYELRAYFDNATTATLRGEAQLLLYLAAPSTLSPEAASTPR